MLVHVNKQDTNSELIDIVDEHDVALYALPRTFAHLLGLRHRSVQLFIYNTKGEIFLQLRSMIKGQYPARFDVSVAGHVLTSESYRQALARECYEELGINLNHSLRKIIKCQPDRNNGYEFSEIYIMAMHDFFNLNNKEVIGGFWYAQDLLLDYCQSRPDEFVEDFAHKLQHVVTAFKVIG